MCVPLGLFLFLSCRVYGTEKMCVKHDGTLVRLGLVDVVPKYRHKTPRRRNPFECRMCAREYRDYRWNTAFVSFVKINIRKKWFLLFSFMGIVSTQFETNPIQEAVLVDFEVSKRHVVCTNSLNKLNEKSFPDTLHISVFV